MTRNDQVDILNNKYQFKFKENFRVSVGFIEIFKLLSIAFIVIGLIGIANVWKISLPYLVELQYMVHAYLVNTILNNSDTGVKTISQMLVSPRFYLSFFLMLGFLLMHFHICILMFKKMVLIANYKTWFKDTNPTFKPFLFFKGEELVPANRDLHDYGIKYEILNLMDLKMSILDNWIKDNQNMYKIKLTNGQNVLKEVELTENEMFEHSRGFRVK